jgi:hypothetical protein
MKNRSGVTKQFRAALISMSVVSVTSCTAYTPIHGAGAMPGTNVRLRLTDQGAVDLTPKIGPRARELEGSLTQITDSSMIVAIRRVVREGEGQDTYDGLEVSIPAKDIETAEASKTSVSRSILAAGAIVASAFLIAKGAGNVSGGGGNRPPPAGQ